MPESRNWAHLPKELANLISKKLPPDRAYFLCFRAVCKNWRSSVPLSDTPIQLPWLIEGETFGKNHLGSYLRFYSLAGGYTGTITVRITEPFRGMVYNGPGHTYLLLSSLKNDYYLLNPLAGIVIPLPKLKDGLKIWSPASSSLGSIHNLQVSYNMLRSDTERCTTGIYHADQNTWTYVENDFDNMSCHTCCWDGKLFATEDAHPTDVFDAFTSEKLYEVPPPEDEVNEENLLIRTYLVESCGEILRVSWYLTDMEWVGVAKFDIYKLYSGEGQHSWTKVGDIGDQIVFLDRENGFSMRAPAGFEGNCIYLMSEFGDTPSRYDIGTKILEKVPCPFTKCTWFIPNLG